MTRSELRTLVLQWLDDPNGGYFTEATVNLWLNLAQREVQKRLLKAGSGFYSVPVETSLVNGQAEYALPNDYIKLYRLEIILSGTGYLEDRKRLNPITNNQQRFLGNQLGEPIGYVINKNRLTLFPTPNSNLTLRMYYAPLISDLTTDSQAPDVPDEYQELVAVIAAENGYVKDDRSPAILQAKKAMYEKTLDETADERHEDEPRRVIITDEEDYIGMPY